MDIQQQIDALLREADECEMIGGLACDKATRQANRPRAAQLRQLASEAQTMLAVQGRLSTA